jgi:hypothetical protein
LVSFANPASAQHRLARNVHFISGLMETGVPVVAADMLTATPFMLHIYAAMAEAEGIAISTRTKGALCPTQSLGQGAGLAYLGIQVAEPSVGIRLEDPAISSEVPVRMFAASVT